MFCRWTGFSFDSLQCEGWTLRYKANLSPALSCQELKLHTAEFSVCVMLNGMFSPCLEKQFGHLAFCLLGVRALHEHAACPGDSSLPAACSRIWKKIYQGAVLTTNWTMTGSWFGSDLQSLLDQIKGRFWSWPEGVNRNVWFLVSHGLKWASACISHYCCFHSYTTWDSHHRDPLLLIALNLEYYFILFLCT